MFVAFHTDTPVKLILHYHISTLDSIWNCGSARKWSDSFSLATIQNRGSAVKVVENNSSFPGSVFGQLWKSPFLNTSTSHTSNYCALMIDGNLHHLWWARARFPEETGGWCPGCSTCSSARRWNWSCGRASSATCWDSLGKTGPAPPQRAHRPAHPVSCPGAVLDKVTPNLSRANISHQTL